MEMMNFKSLLPHALIGLSLTVAACAEAPDDETVSETTSNLSVSSWGASLGSPEDTWRGVQAATLNGVTYAVTAGNCGSWDCFPYEDDNGLYWQTVGPSGWSNQVSIPNQSSNSKVSLAAFNGFLYMVHTGTDDSGATWISRFNPATQQWTANYQIPYTSFAGPPAIAVYNNLLYFIGTGPYPYPMWYATMTTGESFSRPIAIPGHDSASRPSAAVLFNKLYFAHRWGSTGDIVYGSFDGSTWAAAAHIPGGNAGGTLRGVEPVLAADAGVLHLVHLRPEGDAFVWWTYFDGCNWAAAEVTIGTQQSSLGPSLTQGGPGLQLITTAENVDLFGLASYLVYSNAYAHPFTIFPPRVPTCGIVRSPN